MKCTLVIVCLLIGAIMGQKLLPLVSNYSAASNAICVIIQKYFMKDIATVDFVKAPLDDRQNLKMESIVNEVLLQCEVDFRKSDYQGVNFIKQNRFNNIFIVSGYQSFSLIRHLIVQEMFIFQGLFLIVMIDFYDEQLKDIEIILKDVWELHIINVNILVKKSFNETSPLELFTFFPFTPIVCGRIIPFSIDQYENSRFVYERNQYEDKLKNLYGCSLKTAIFNIPPLMMIKGNDANEKIRLSGIDGELLNGELFFWVARFSL